MGQDWQGDVRVVLFVRLQPGVALDEALQQADPRDHPRAAPRRATCRRKIIAVPDIPRTLSGKLTELAVRNVIHGLPVKNLDALANPQRARAFSQPARAAELGRSR